MVKNFVEILFDCTYIWLKSHYMDFISLVQLQFVVKYI